MKKFHQFERLNESLNIKEIKESVSKILDLGGSVSFSYKEKLSDWYMNIKIYHYKYYGEGYRIDNGPEFGDYESKEVAIDKYIHCIFNENNLAIILERIRKKLNVETFDEIKGFDFQRPSKEFLSLIEDEKLLYKKEILHF